MSESKALKKSSAEPLPEVALPPAPLDEAWLDAIGCLVAILDRNGRVVTANRACEAVIGYARGEIVGRAFWALLLPPLDAEAMQAACAAFEKKRPGPPRSVLCRVRSGAERLIEWSRTRTADPEDSAAHIILSSIDVTDAKAVESALRESERSLARAQEVAKIGYWRWSIGAKGMIYVSKQYTEILGLPLSKALVEMHGGTLEIESTLGAGTTVTLRLPAARIAPRPAGAPLRGG